MLVEVWEPLEAFAARPEPRSAVVPSPCTEDSDRSSAAVRIPVTRSGIAIATAGFPGRGIWLLSHHTWREAVREPADVIADFGRGSAPQSI